MQYLGSKRFAQRNCLTTSTISPGEHTQGPAHPCTGSGSCCLCGLGWFRSAAPHPSHGGEEEGAIGGRKAGEVCELTWSMRGAGVRRGEGIMGVAWELGVTEVRSGEQQTRGPHGAAR